MLTAGTFHDCTSSWKLRFPLLKRGSFLPPNVFLLVFVCTTWAIKAQSDCLSAGLFFFYFLTVTRRFLLQGVEVSRRHGALPAYLLCGL